MRFTSMAKMVLHPVAFYSYAPHVLALETHPMILAIKPKHARIIADNRPCLANEISFVGAPSEQTRIRKIGTNL